MSPESKKPKRKPPNAGKGRGKGNLNKTTLAAKEFAEAMLNRTAYEKSLRRRLDAGKAPHMEILLHHYRSGKPKETIEHHIPMKPVIVDLLTLGEGQKVDDSD